MPKEIGGGGRYFTHEQRITQIAYHVALAAALGKDGHTMYSMARVIDMQPSSHLTRILNTMCDEKLLKFEVMAHRSNINKRRYFPSPRLYSDARTAHLAQIGLETGAGVLKKRDGEREKITQKDMFT